MGLLMAQDGPALEQGSSSVVALLLCRVSDARAPCPQAQMHWLKEDLERRLDRRRTPWFVAVFHAPWCEPGCVPSHGPGAGGAQCGPGGSVGMPTPGQMCAWLVQHRGLGVCMAKSFPSSVGAKPLRCQVLAPTSPPLFLPSTHATLGPSPQVHLVCGALL